jgi:hypothetical protein
MTTRRHLDLFMRSNRGHLKLAGRKCCCTSYAGSATLTSVEESGTAAPTLQLALFWMNIYRDLLVVDETALLRMRALITDGENGKHEAYYTPDVELVVSEIERVRERLDHWLGLVDRLS